MIYIYLVCVRCVRVCSRGYLFLGFYMFKIPLFIRLFYTELFKWSVVIFTYPGHDGQEKYQSSSMKNVKLR